MKNTYYKSEPELQEMARGIAGKVTIRYMENGSSRDVTYESNAQEFSAIYNVALGALLTANFRNVLGHNDTRNDELQVILDQAEFTLDLLFAESHTSGDFRNCQEVNGYDTIYLPLRACFKKWIESAEKGV